MKVELSLHPHCQPGTIDDVSAEVSHKDGAWHLTYVVLGDSSRLVIPKKSEPRRADNLWQSTCFEAFVRHAEGDEYAELNFSPSREWAAYRFDSHRAGIKPLDLPKEPRIAAERSERVFRLSVELTAPDEFVTDDLRVNLAAVIEEKDGTKSYWAIAHPPGEPDFHHPNCFVATLP